MRLIPLILALAACAPAPTEIVYACQFTRPNTQICDDGTEIEAPGLLVCQNEETGEILYLLLPPDTPLPEIGGEIDLPAWEDYLVPEEFIVWTESGPRFDACATR